MARVSTITTERIPIPHEPGEWMRFQMLSYLTLDKSRKVRMAELTAETATLSKETIAQIREELAAAKNAPVIKAEPIQKHDRATLLRHGIAEWSYEGAVDAEDLDDRTADWAAREILALSEPTDDDLKKGSLRAIAS